MGLSTKHAAKNDPPRPPLADVANRGNGKRTFSGAVPTPARAWGSLGQQPRVRAGGGGSGGGGRPRTSTATMDAGLGAYRTYGGDATHRPPLAARPRIIVVPGGPTAGLPIPDGRFDSAGRDQGRAARNIMGAEITKEVTKMRDDRGYVPQDGRFIQRVAALEWELEQEHAARILRFYGAGHRAGATYMPAGQATGGHLLFRQRGFMRGRVWK